MDILRKRSRSIHILIPLLLVLVVWIGGCSGNGRGLDVNGNPVGSSGSGLPVAFEPTFQNIQQNVFSSICIACHTGSGAPQGLQLDAAHAYQMLVNVPSVERSDLVRVQPGNPDASYIIQKLEGSPGIVGGQMPFNRPPLPQTTINAIRVWIAQGAPNN